MRYRHFPSFLANAFIRGSWEERNRFSTWYTIFQYEGKSRTGSTHILARLHLNMLHHKMLPAREYGLARHQVNCQGTPRTVTVIVRRTMPGKRMVKMDFAFLHRTCYRLRDNRAKRGTILFRNRERI